MKIVFFNEATVTIGGGLMMAADLATYIAENYSEHEVYFICKANPKLNQIFSTSKAHFCNVDTFDFGQLDGAIFYAPFNYLFYLLAQIKELKSAKLLLHFYHPYVIEWLFRQLPYWEKNKMDILSLVCENNAYCMMDKSDLLAANTKSPLKFGKNYLPNAAHDNYSVDIAPPPLISKERINIGWLGRLDNDKIFSIINLADNLLRSNIHMEIDLHLIGDGYAKNKINTRIYSPNIRFIFTSYLYEDERNRYIRDNIDIMVAMGLSSVASSALGVPTVIPCVSEKPFYTDRFVYIYDALEYGQGWKPEDLPALAYKTSPIKEIINDIYFRGLKEPIGKKCFQYCKENFNIQKSSYLFLNMIPTCTLTVGKCMACKSISKQMLRFTLYQKIRPNRDFAAFHKFISRINQLEHKKGLKKIIFILRETYKTLNRGLK